MQSETQLLEAGGRVARDVGGKVLEQSGGFFSSFFGAPFALAGNVARGAWGGLWSWLTPAAAVVGGVLVAAPDLILGAGELTGRTDISTKVGDEIGKSSTGGLALKVAGASVALSSGIGAITGVVQSLTGGGPQDAPPLTTSARIGQFAGTALTFAGIAAVTMGAISSGKVAHDKGGERDVTPPMPPKAGQGQRVLDA